MAQLRSVNTKFWDDPWIESLTISEKLLFLYLITNSYANLVGVYEITIKRICFETGLDSKTVLKGLEQFGRVRKAYFINDNFMFLPNWLKNQNLNTNMKKGVLKIINELPKDVRIIILGNGYQTIQNDYQSIRNTLLKYEVEVLEDEEEIEEEVVGVLFNDFWDKYHSITKCSKTDKEPTLKYWGKLTESERLKSINNIEPYYKSLSDKKYCKKARTYLSDKNFNDEYDLSHSSGQQITPTLSAGKKPEPFKGYN